MTDQWQRWVATGLTAGFVLASAAIPVAAQISGETDESTPDNSEMPEADEPAVPTAEEGVSLPDEAVRFTCEVQNGQPTVMYAPVSQPGSLSSTARSPSRCSTAGARPRTPA